MERGEEGDREEPPDRPNEEENPERGPEKEFEEDEEDHIEKLIPDVELQEDDYIEKLIPDVELQEDGEPRGEPRESGEDVEKLIPDIEFEGEQEQPQTVEKSEELPENGEWEREVNPENLVPDEVPEAAEWSEIEELGIRREDIERLIPDVEFRETEFSESPKVGEEVPHGEDLEKFVEDEGDKEGLSEKIIEDLVPDIESPEVEGENREGGSERDLEHVSDSDSFEKQDSPPETNNGSSGGERGVEEEPHQEEEGKQEYGIERGKAEEHMKGGGEQLRGEEVVETDRGTIYKKSWVEDNKSLRTEAHYEVRISRETHEGVVHSEDVRRWTVSGERRDFEDKISRVVSLSREESYRESQFPRGKEPIIFMEPKEEEAPKKVERVVVTSDSRLSNIERVEIERKIWATPDGRTLLVEERRTLCGQEKQADKGSISFSYQCTDRGMFGEAAPRREGETREKLDRDPNGKDGGKIVGEYLHSGEFEHRGADGTVQTTLGGGAPAEGDKQLILWEKETIHIKYTTPEKGGVEAKEESKQFPPENKEGETATPENKKPQEAAPPEIVEQSSSPASQTESKEEKENGAEKKTDSSEESSKDSSKFKSSEAESGGLQEGGKEGREREKDGEKGKERVSEKTETKKEKVPERGETRNGGENRGGERSGVEGDGRGEEKEPEESREHPRISEKDSGGEFDSSEVELPRVVLSEDVDEVVRRAVVKGGGREGLIARMKELKLQFDEKQIREYEYFKNKVMDRQTFLSLLIFLEGALGVRGALGRLRVRLREAEEEVISGENKAEQYVCVYDSWSGAWGILSLPEVVKLLWEAEKKAGSLEKLAEQLRKMRRGAIVYAYLINEWFRSRRIPREVLLDIIKYVEGTQENVERRIDEIVRETYTRILSNHIREMGALTPFRLAQDPLTIRDIEERAEQIYNSDRSLQQLFSLEDFKYVMKIVVGGLLRGLPSPRNEEEETKIEEAIGEAAKYFERLLGEAKENLLDQTIEKLNDEEALSILNAAMNRKKQQLGTEVKIGKLGENGYLTQLARETKIKTRTLRNYIDMPYITRQRMRRRVFLEICDVLNLPQAMREGKRAGRGELLGVFLTVTQKLEKGRRAQPDKSGSGVLSPLSFLGQPHLYPSTFEIPLIYKHPNGKTVEIRESGERAFVVVDGRPLEAAKRVTKRGGGWWGITIVDYETEEGVYTVVLELGELWTPLVTPWFIAPRDWDIGFESAQTLQSLLLKIEESLPNISREDLAKIAGPCSDILWNMVRGEKTSATLSVLLSLIALKCMLAQTDLKGEIQKIEQVISKIERWELPKQRRTMLYINLKTPHGAALIGHTVGDGNLYDMGEKCIVFTYLNAEYSYAENVAKILGYYGFKSRIRIRIRTEEEGGEKAKTQFVASTGGLLAYALFRAVPKALGEKTRGNPKVPTEIIENPRLAPFFIKAMIKDEAHIDPKKKDMTIEIYVDVTEKIGKNRAQKISATADKQIREKEKKKGKKLTPSQEVAARHIKTEEVNEETKKLAETVPCKILISLKEALQTKGINITERGIQHFYASPQGYVTACWQIHVPKKEMKKVYEKKLLEGTGPKEAAYKTRYKALTSRVRLVDEENNIWKLSKEQAEKIRKKHEEYQQKKKMETERVPLSKIKKDPDFREIAEIINKNTPNRLEKKKAELEKKGIKTQPKPKYIHILKKVISVEWKIEWFEPPEENRNGRS